MKCYLVKWPHVECGILVTDGGEVRHVEHAISRAQWMVGKTLDYVAAWVTQRGGSVERVTDSQQEKHHDQPQKTGERRETDENSNGLAFRQ